MQVDVAESEKTTTTRVRRGFKYRVRERCRGPVIMRRREHRWSISRPIQPSQLQGRSLPGLRLIGEVHLHQNKYEHESDQQEM